jgi:hypothetical protein
MLFGLYDIVHELGVRAECAGWRDGMKSKQALTSYEASVITETKLSTIRCFTPLVSLRDKAGLG